MFAKKMIFVLSILCLGIGGVGWFGTAATNTQAAPTANTITVTTPNDTMDAFDQLCSLREALHNANTQGEFSPVVNECVAGSAVELNVIALQSGATYTLTIAGTGDDEGDLDVLADVRLEVTGGENLATIRSQVVGQGVLEVHAGATADLANLTLRDGTVAGGIFNSGHITLTHVTVQNNLATAGGGLYNAATGTAVVVDSQIILNDASDLFGGGGIVNLGTLELNNSQVRANTAASGGGGIRNEGPLNIHSNSVVNLNTSGGSGGGIYNAEGGEVTITNSAVDSNTAAEEGGGIFSTGNLSGSSLTVINSTISGNTATTGDGGGVEVQHGATFTNIELNDNTAGDDGGGLLANFPIEIHGATIQRNQSAFDGGGLWISTLTADGLMVQDNSGRRGGGIFSSLETILTNSQILSNTATTDGGGIYVAASAFTTTAVDQTVIAYNQATQEGGGIWVENPLTISNSTISSNGATGGGGGFYIDMAGVVTATNITLAHNLLGQDLHKYGDMILQNSIISTPDFDNCTLGLDKPVLISLGNNVVDDTSCLLEPQTSDVTNVPVLLGLLADNGGNTWTHALLEGSPAIGAADEAACTAAPVSGVDQRGFIRPAGACDSGAFQTGGLGNFIYLPLVVR